MNDSIQINKVIRIIAELVMILGTCFVIGLTIHTVAARGKTEARMITDCWYDGSDKAADIISFDRAEGKSVTTTLDGIGANYAIVISERNMFSDVYVDNVLLDRDDRDIPHIFGSSPGTRWRTITLEESKGPVKLTLTGYSCFDNSAGYIDEIYFGEIGDIYRLILSQNILKFVLGILWVIMGLVCIVVYAVGHKHLKLRKDFLYLSVGTLFCAIWCSSETHMWQFFMGYSEVVHMISYVSLFVIPVPFALLICYRLEGNWKRASIIYAVVAEAASIIAFMLNLVGVAEYHYTAWVVRVLIGILFPFAVKLIHGYSLGEKAKRFAKYMYMAFVFLVALLAIGIIYYVVGKYKIYAVYIRWSLFLLLFILFGYQFTGVSDLFVKGLQSELLHELALTDYLTKFYNRSGFAEHRERYDNPEKPIGIIQFDVNNLKSVNDNQGHEKGDELICLASSGIYQSFAACGTCYRMGGDEFLVVLTGDNPAIDYKKGIALLEEYCGYANSVEDRTFDVKIAHGFTIKSEDETFNNAMERADSLMYANKKMMKAERR